MDQRLWLCSGHRAMPHLLGHLFGTVGGQAKTYNGQHHGDLVKGAVLRLGLNLTGYLPLQIHEERTKLAEQMGFTVQVQKGHLILRIISFRTFHKEILQKVSELK